MYSLNRPDPKYQREDSERNQRLDTVANAAGGGIEHWRAAIDRLNELEKAAPGP